MVDPVGACSFDLTDERGYGDTGWDTHYHVHVVFNAAYGVHDAAQGQSFATQVAVKLRFQRDRD